MRRRECRLMTLRSETVVEDRTSRDVAGGVEASYKLEEFVITENSTTGLGRRQKRKVAVHCIPTSTSVKTQVPFAATNEQNLNGPQACFIGSKLCKRIGTTSRH